MAGPGGYRPGAGRKRGAKWTKKLRLEMENLRQDLPSLNCDPIKGMEEIAKHRKASLELRGRMYAELAGYIYAKRKAVEHTGPAGEPVSLRIKIDWVDPPTG